MVSNTQLENWIDRLNAMNSLVCYETAGFLKQIIDGKVRFEKPEWPGYDERKFN